MLLSFENWWQAMEVAEKIYWCIAVPFSLVFLIQLIMTLFGGDFDSSASVGDADVSVDGDHGIGFQFISIKNLVAFFTIFGWTGIACMSGGLSPVLTVVIALVAGLLMMLLMAFLIYNMSKLAEDGTMKMKAAIGKTATVYLTIPAKRSAQGKVQMNFHGFQTLDAVTDDEVEIKNGSMVKVLDIINDEILIVTKL
jgi:hypothetical protein